MTTICVKHLYANFRDASHRGVDLKEKLWQAATTYTKRDFGVAMEELKALSQPAYDYLKVIDPSQWTKSSFNTFPKFDLVVNNLSECFNAYILQARDKPIVTMVETIRKKLMRRYQLKREVIDKWENTITPWIVAKFELMHDLSIYFTPTYAGCGQFEIHNASRQYVVDLEKRTCSCLRWDMTGHFTTSNVRAFIALIANNPIYAEDALLESPSHPEWKTSPTGQTNQLQAPVGRVKMLAKQQPSKQSARLMGHHS
ncbi:uncharacterized protein LOC122274541 [Carya illinoinensis]|uniref:uncharacterized protein LOC122274541 n=1 Tax=Carya illinoinensis TaxID=32201 RepID=UPI001C725960|nr:uncharacterized protein LOC122274541 [Carya illinoinensis]